MSGQGDERTNPFSVGDPVRVVDAVKTRYFAGSDPARRAGWTGKVRDLCGPVFPDYVYVDFDLQPRQKRQRLREFVAVRDLEIAA